MFLNGLAQSPRLIFSLSFAPLITWLVSLRAIASAIAVGPKSCLEPHVVFCCRYLASKSLMSVFRPFQTTDCNLRLTHKKKEASMEWKRSSLAKGENDTTRRLEAARRLNELTSLA